MSRIKELFARLDSRKALVTFVTAGDPTLEHTVPALHAMVAGGADLLELGIPFSDPEAEGPTIQASSERALRNGTTLRKVLAMVQQFRQRDESTPIVLMGYLNSVLAMADFAERAQQAGVDGLIMVNLPPEAAHEMRADLAAHDIDIIFLVAPTTTDERARMIFSQSQGFVYYVSLKGITGADHMQSDAVNERMRHLQQMSDLPICVGFGIKDAAGARAVSRYADGVVVGSALVSLLAEHPDDPAHGAQALQAAVADLRRGLDHD